jgi:talin
LTSEQLAPLITQISTLVEALSNNIVEVAGKTKDTQSQQEILSAGQALAITIQQLALAAQNANKNPDDETAGELLMNSVQNVSNSINDLISVVQTSTAQSRRGETELDNTSNQIKLILTQSEQDPNPSILNVVNGARKCCEAIATLVFATSQDDLINGAKVAEEGIKAILSNLSAKSPNQNVQRALLEAAQNSAKAMLELLNSVKSGDRDNPQTKTLIQTKGEDLTSLLNELVGVCNKYPEAMSLSLVEENLELKAEQQLLAAVELIKKAAQELSLTTIPEKGKKERTFGQTLGLEFDDYDITSELLESVKEVVKCGTVLLECAIVAQSERKEQNKNNMKYRNDPTWANGLISSAKSVSQSLMLLVRACNAAVRGELEEEAIIALSSTVAAATAQLVTASRVRANPNSKAQKELDLSAKQVARSTDKMVKTAKKFTELREKQEDQIPSNPNLINKLEQQMSILRLEKQLEQARKNLGKINKEEYTKGKKE